jgi:hypothetical protein
MSRLLAAAAAALCAAAAQAAPSIIHGDLLRGAATFDAAVRAAGSVVSTQRLMFLSDGATRFDFPDFVITGTDGGRRYVEDDYMDLRRDGVTGAMSGWSLGISPNNPAPLWGLTFDFRRPVNAFGLEVGDWATCCFASALYIAFDGGATRLVASASGQRDNPGFRAYGQFTNFVGAIDTAGSFRRVTFYGDGLGEFIVAGGTIRYSALPVDVATTGTSPVPEPAPWQMLLVGAAAVAIAVRRRAG